MYMEVGVKLERNGEMYHMLALLYFGSNLS